MLHIEKLVHKTDEVRKATLSSANIDTAERYVTAFNTLLLDKTSIPVGIIWSNAIFECSILAESSYFLAIHGMYEQACIMLRTIIDGFLTRMYWDICNDSGDIRRWVRDGRSTNEYAEWELGISQKYPHRREDVWPKLLSDPRILAYDMHHHLRPDVESLTASLDKFVHGRPAARHFNGAFRGSTLAMHFESTLFDTWREHLIRVYIAVLLISYLLYPALLAQETAKDFELLEPTQFSRLRVCLRNAGANGAA